MGRGYFSGKPLHNTLDWCTFQIGQCRLHIHISQTKEFYKSQPKITENCVCAYCSYFETKVINQPYKLFEILNKMGVDLSRQPNINPDGICCVGDTKQNMVGYMGYYFVFGEIGKTSKSTKKADNDNVTSKVNFNDTEFGKYTQVTIKQDEPDKIIFEFYMDVVKSIEISI